MFPMFIYGGPATGKTRYAKQLAAHFGKESIIDEWVLQRGCQNIPTGNVLVLCQERPKADVHCMPIEQALKEIGVA